MSILDNEEVLIQCLADEYKVLQQCIYKSYIFKDDVDTDGIWRGLLGFPEDCIKEFVENLIKESYRDIYIVNIVRTQKKSSNGRGLLIIDIQHVTWYSPAATIIFIKKQ